MGKSHKKSSSRTSHSSTRLKGGIIEWVPRMTMNMSDLSRDDDFLNHLLVEKLGTGNIPLYVHKMDPTRALPKTDPKDLLAIVQRVRFSHISAHTLVMSLTYAFGCLFGRVSDSSSPLRSQRRKQSSKLLMSCSSKPRVILSLILPSNATHFQAACSLHLHQKVYSTRNRCFRHVCLPAISP